MSKKKPIFSIEMYMRWPLILTVATLLFNVLIFVMYPRFGAALFAVSAFVALFCIVIYISSRSGFNNWLIRYAGNFGIAEARLLREMSLSAAVIDQDGNVLWGNDSFSGHFGSGDVRRIQNIFPDITKEILSDLTEASIIHSTFGERRYLVEMLPAEFDGPDAITGNALFEDSEDNDGYAGTLSGETQRSLIFVTISDETERVAYKKAYEESRSCEGLIYIDNYDEVLDSIEDVRKSLLTAFVERRINGYISSFNGVVRKLEKDKYFFFIKERDLDRMIEDKFTLLNDVKGISIGNAQRVTVSIGIGKSGREYSDNYKFANSAIEFALGRGGDQVVLKDGTDIVFYGGKTEAKEKHVRVKARVKAQALKDLLNTADKLIVMGHKNADIDCLGAAIGIWCIATSFGKKAWVAIGEPNRSLRPMYDRFRESGQYPEDLFISGDAALARIDPQTVLVVVDVNRPVITEEPELLKRAKSIVVIDHHRRTRDVIDNAVLTYIEPYASSACELVSEIVQYMDMDVELTPLEADAMYGGIMIDTQNFVNQTGVRTLEAASYLKSKGADVTRIRKLFRDSYNDFRARADAIDRAEIYREYFALSTCNADLADTPTVIGAQAANSLLEIDKIKAAVVLTSYDGKIYVSARSIDDVNVQVMMEKIGGGGHMSVAGAQLEGVTAEEAGEMVKKVIDEMMEEGDVS